MPKSYKGRTYYFCLAKIWNECKCQNDIVMNSIFLANKNDI